MIEVINTLTLGLVYDAHFETRWVLSKLVEVSYDAPSVTAVLFVGLQKGGSLPLDQLFRCRLHILAFNCELSGLNLGVLSVVGRIFNKLPGFRVVLDLCIPLQRVVALHHLPALAYWRRLSSRF